MTLEIQKNKCDNTLMQYVIHIWKQARWVVKIFSIDRNFRNKIRRVSEEDY